MKLSLRSAQPQLACPRHQALKRSERTNHKQLRTPRPGSASVAAGPGSALAARCRFSSGAFPGTERLPPGLPPSHPGPSRTKTPRAVIEGLRPHPRYSNPPSRPIPDMEEKPSITVIIPACVRKGNLASPAPMDSCGHRNLPLEEPLPVEESLECR